MKKVLSIVVLIVLVIVGGIYYFSNTHSPESVPQTQQNLQTQASSTNFKMFTDLETGFTISYPSLYTLRASPAPTNAWASRSLLTISNNSTSASNAPSSALTVGLQKQPVEANGKIYHTIADYQQSGVAAHMAQGATNPKGELVTVNGTQALLFHFPSSESTGFGPADSYSFIKDDLVYEVGVNPSDSNQERMLQSISWKK